MTEPTYRVAELEGFAGSCGMDGQSVRFEHAPPLDVGDELIRVGGVPRGELIPVPKGWSPEQAWKAIAAREATQLVARLDELKERIIYSRKLPADAANLIADTIDHLSGK